MTGADDTTVSKSETTHSETTEVTRPDGGETETRRHIETHEVHEEVQPPPVTETTTTTTTIIEE